VSFGRGLGQLALFLRWALCFDPFLSPASPPITVFSLSLLPSRLSCSIPCNFPLQQIVSSLALLIIIPASLIPFLSIPSGWCLPYCGVGILFWFVICCPGIRLVPINLVLGRSLLSQCHVGADRLGVRSVPVVPVLGRCLFSRYEVGHCCPVCKVGPCGPVYKVGASRPVMRSVTVIVVWGWSLSSQYEVGFFVQC